MRGGAPLAPGRRRVNIGNRQRLRVAWGTAALLALLAAAPPGAARAADGRAQGGERRIAPDVFRGALAIVGEWVVLRGGVVAWRPDGVAVDWQPYRDGHWTWTSDGWFWVSAEPWAWATYHYGRWRLDPAKGWVWLPGDRWAPARVVWRLGGGAVGWAPETDDGFVLSGHWTFLPAARMEGVQIPAGAIPPPRVPRLLVSTRPMSGSQGPGRAEAGARRSGALVAGTDVPAPPN